MKSDTTPGSSAHQIATMVAEASRAAGRGIEVAEIRDSYSTAGFAIRDTKVFNAEVYSLVRRGILVRTGGRSGKSRYCHRDWPIAEPDDAGSIDDGELVLRALRSAFAKHGRGVSTREVHAEARNLGLPVDGHPNLVRKRLETLARPRARGHEDWHAPTVILVRAARAAGRMVSYWLPAGEERGDSPGHPWSRAEAVRLGFLAVQEELGRPATRRELRWWVDAHGASDPVAAAVEPDRLARDIRSALRWDSSRPDGTDHLREFRGRLTCHGGPAPRYAVGPIPEGSDEVCAVQDACYLLRPADELEGIEWLRGMADRERSGALRQLEDLRSAALPHAFHALVGPVSPRLLGIIRADLEKLGSWAGASGAGEDVRSKRQREVQELLRQTAAIENFQSPPDQLGSAVLGQSGLTALDSLEPLLRSAGTIIEIDEKAQIRLLVSARRLPNPEAEAFERLAEGVPTPLSLLDRVDAISAIFAAAAIPMASTMVEMAGRVLGHVVRDVDTLYALLSDLPPSDVLARRTLCVAMGLLGVAPDLSVAAPNPSDIGSAAAWALSAVCAAPHTAAKEVRRLEQHVGPEHSRAVFEMTSRAMAGDLISVVG